MIVSDVYKYYSHIFEVFDQIVYCLSCENYSGINIFFVFEKIIVIPSLEFLVL